MLLFKEKGYFFLEKTFSAVVYVILKHNQYCYGYSSILHSLWFWLSFQDESVVERWWDLTSNLISDSDVLECLKQLSDIVDSALFVT